MTEKLLPQIKNPADLKQLPREQLPALAKEIRQLIKDTVSRNGGHLASNLGVVELTIALHYVFDFKSDRLTWDVGHQCYVHKILTGRADQFDTLRKGGGISGFPSPAESPCDQFFVGHGGTSITTALGLALGAQVKQTDEKVVAVVGDASIVNGVSFEGLNNTSLVNRQMLIILNDNSMAIDTTQGAFANYLSKLRLSRSYDDIHRTTKALVRRLPYFGQAIQESLHRIKDGIKGTLLSSQIFEQLGIPYFGPIDGHDISAMIELLEAFKKVDHPVLMHVQTEKGRGFGPAYKDPCTFHSPKPFKVNGETAQFSSSSEKSFTKAFAQALTKLMVEDETIIAFTAAMPDGTGLALVRERFPERVFDVGIAESSAVDIAAGMAKTGSKPVVAIYSTFLQRGFDQVFQEVSLQNLPVIFCMDRAGLVGGDGAVHHGFCDISLLRSLPNMILMAPMDEPELMQCLRFALDSGSPCAVRYPRDNVPPPFVSNDQPESPDYELGKARWLRKGKDVAFLTYGVIAYTALEAAKELAKEGVEATVVNARFAKPIDEVLLTELGKGKVKRPIITLEDHALAGGFGSAVLETAQEMGLDTRRIVRMGLPDNYIEHHSRKDQLAQAELDSASIVEKVRTILGR
ncbi:MAG: 1-deoxy-D-xylulose-5-phosphate synthase [Planctomycetes bacterium]|nr:1-deoxy-D-xylulose-5-phosphate synthase [Planctomycetota bacterium]